MSASEKIKYIAQEILNKITPHMKVFLVMIIITISFLVIWVVIKPEDESSPGIVGVVPFPPIELNIPPDSTICGTAPQFADPKDPRGPCAKCQEKGGNNDYSPVDVGDKNVWYMGTKLNAGTTYCLPKQAQNDIRQCGTYTGKSVLTSTDQGLQWKCDCLYPDFYNGSSCVDPVVCSYKDEDGTIRSSPLTNSQNVAWDPTNMDASLVGVNPHELDANNKPVFRCNNCPSGYYNTENEPYRCQKDLCYIGSYSSPAAKFNVDLDKCVCDPISNMVQSNISGFCYPDNTNTCYPHLTTGGCTFDIDISNTIFTLNGVTYASLTRNLTGTPRNYNVLVNMSNSNQVLTNIDDVSNSSINNSLQAYPILQWSDITEDEKNTIRQNNQLKASAMDTISQRMTDNLKNNQIQPIIGIPCNSFFYKHPDSTIPVPECKDVDIEVENSSDTDLNKTGYAGQSLCTRLCTNDGGTCNVDIKKNIYCACPSGKVINSLGGCTVCKYDGKDNVEPKDTCCSTGKPASTARDSQANIYYKCP